MCLCTPMSRTIVDHKLTLPSASCRVACSYDLAGKKPNSTTRATDGAGAEESWRFMVKRACNRQLDNAACGGSSLARCEDYLACEACSSYMISVTQSLLCCVEYTADCRHHYLPESLAGSAMGGWSFFLKLLKATFCSSTWWATIHMWERLRGGG